jgi:hypothetical protein
MQDLGPVIATVSKHERKVPVFLNICECVWSLRLRLRLRLLCIQRAHTIHDQFPLFAI